MAITRDTRQMGMPGLFGDPEDEPVKVMFKPTQIRPPASPATIRRNYRGPVGQLQRETLTGMKAGTAYRVPTFAEDRSRREVLEKLLDRGLIERIKGKPHLVKRVIRERRGRCRKA